MPVLLRFLVVAVVAFIAGSTVTPLLWQPVLVQQSKQILSPYALVSVAIFLAALGYVIGQWKR